MNNELLLQTSLLLLTHDVHVLFHNQMRFKHLVSHSDKRIKAASIRTNPHRNFNTHTYCK